MIWSEVIAKYGKKNADLMKKSEMLMGITVTMRDGKMDIPESDIYLAYKDKILKKKINHWEID